MSSPPNFNHLATPYRWLERLSFGPFLALCRYACLEQARSCRHALILGDGDGRFTARLLRENPTILVDAVDASPAMLRALIRRAGPHAARLRTHQSDARIWRPENLGGPGPVLSPSKDQDLRTSNSNYDLVVTHFFLDCLTTEEIHSLAIRLRPALTPSARWIVSEFAIPPTGYGRLVARPLVAALYKAFGLLTGLTVRTLPDHPAALHAAGFTLLRRRPRLAGLLVSELWSQTAPDGADSPPFPIRVHPSEISPENVTNVLKLTK